MFKHWIKTLLEHGEFRIILLDELVSEGIADLTKITVIDRGFACHKLRTLVLFILMTDCTKIEHVSRMCLFVEV